MGTRQTVCQSYSGLGGKCQVRSYHVCETPGPYIYCLESDCVLDDRRCSAANANLNGGGCATQGLEGKCDAVGTCNLIDIECSNELLGASCVDNNRVGYCSVDNEQVEALCSRYRNDKEAYLLCEQTLPGAVVCDVSVDCSGALDANETCTIRGHDGVCKNMCTDYSGGTKSPRECPKPANGTTFTLVESQSVCTWSYDPKFCSQNLANCRNGTSDQYRVSCVLEYASIYPTTDCVRHDTGCQNEYDFCLENNQGGVCLKNANGLYCHDRSDDCPNWALCNSDTGFALPNNVTTGVNNSTHVVRIGQCSPDFYCEPRYVPCDDSSQAQQSECWEGGLRGKCQPYAYSGVRGSRCQLDDTPACSAARIGDACAANGYASECAFSYDVLAHYCPDLESEGCYYTEYGVICHGTLLPPPTYTFFDNKMKKKRQMRPDLPAPVTMEECVQRVLAAGEVPSCLTNAYCSVPSMTGNDSCTVDGDGGKCAGSCYIYAQFTGSVVDIECGSSLTITYAEINAIVTASCNADHQQLEACVAERIASPVASCVEKATGSTYNRECVFNFLRVSRDVRCVRNDRKCARVDQFCIENGLSGKCQSENGSIVCHELSDECPVGSECKVLDTPNYPYPYPYPTKPNPFPYPTDSGPYYPPDKDFPEDGGSSMGSGGSAGSPAPVATIRDGLCSKEYQCMVRHQECGSPDRDKCWINGIAGSCISKSKAQDAQLQQCVQMARDPASCYTRYSTCFTKCRFPTQVCGKSNVCEFGADAHSDTLTCTAIFGEPGLVAEFKQNAILVQVSGPSIYGVAQLVYQSLSENGLSHLSFATIDSTIGYVLLGPEQSLTRTEFNALAVVAQQLRSTNGVSDAFVVLGGKPIEPSELCGKLTCADGFKCSDSKCVRVLAHGLCQQLSSGADTLCVCELGWRGADCAETDTVKTGETKLSQWVFEKKLQVDAASARSKVASAFDSTVDGVRYELVVTETADYVTVRVYLMTAFRDLTSAQVEEIRSAHALLLHNAPGLASSNVYFPAPSPVATSHSDAMTIRFNSLLLALTTVMTILQA